MRASAVRPRASPMQSERGSSPRQASTLPGGRNPTAGSMSCCSMRCRAAGSAGSAMRSLLSLLAAAAFAAHAQAPALQPSVRLVVQSSPLAGFRYAEAAQVWPHLSAGDVLDLVREPDNPHDTNAV